MDFIKLVFLKILAFYMLIETLQLKSTKDQFKHLLIQTMVENTAENYILSSVIFI